ncbi:MAG: bifunctional adenosylcobinamide kinase/adenosylcobinamide-phosphate guanylyltransferase [Lachnospiraceae bacterium]|nr:bifunctional adenosylcobinamide kinase/adenosylcobinamide-phosphate guanylyltransferase [Lachnospiraceae bacterium]
MKLIIGGYAQGKLQYAIGQYDLKECRIYDGVLPVSREGENPVSMEKENSVNMEGENPVSAEEKKSVSREGETSVSGEREQEAVIVNHFHNWVRERIQNGGCPEQEIQTFLESCPDAVIISDEIGNGIVPMEAQEREYRERTGRILVKLAGMAEEVVRVLCGIGQRIK